VLRRLVAMLLCATLLAAPALADDSGLREVARTIAVVRTTRGANTDRDAGPELTPVKQAMRKWVEQSLDAAPTDMRNEPDANRLKTLSDRLYSALKTADLTCDPAKPGKDRCSGDPDAVTFDARGYIDGVSLTYLNEGRYLLVKTGVGVLCGFDASAYIYEARNGHWRLLLQTEQDDYGKDYAPQNFLSVTISPTHVGWNEPAPPPLVLTLGYSPWCASNWQAIYTRLWRAAPNDPAPKPLIDTNDTLYMGDDGVAASNLTDHDVLLQFRGQSIDGGILVRPVVRHYLVGDHDQINRVAPIALNPDDFVDEWLSGDWKDAVKWSALTNRSTALAQWHKSMHRQFIFGDFDGQPTQCTADPTLWQVGFTLSKGLDDDPHPQIAAHFLVRWMAPYGFTMVDVRSDRFPGCDEVVDQPDDLGTLFPVDDWRR
jgi:hypothetical protein